MAVFRVEKNRGYTVMSNHHLRNKALSLKAKGLLSQMLSLPEDWDFTLKGLSLINREQIDAIRAAVRELEQAGYIVRSRERDSQGRLRGADYIIYEQPQPVPDSPTLENPTQEKPTQEKPTQLNKDRSSKEKSITDGSNTDSIPILSPPSPLGEEAAAPPERKGTGAKSQSAVEIYREIIKDNIEYEHLCQYAKGIDRDMLDEIVDLLVETVCSARKTIRIAGDDYPAELVKSKLMKLNSSHIEFVFDCISKNTTEMEVNLWNFSIVQLILCRPSLWASAERFAYGAASIFWRDTGRTTRRAMLMYGREAQSKTKTASPATIPKSGERNRKIHSCMLYLISI